jgi:hypothetical protein
MGTELTGMAILRWSQETRVEWHYIAPGKPQQNAFSYKNRRQMAVIPDGEVDGQAQTDERVFRLIDFFQRHGMSL